jgi:hypothetical protein
MQYKTIMLELLQDYPRTHQRLSTTRQLLPTLDRYAEQLKTTHQHWMERLRMAKPAMDAVSVTSAALEMALEELRRRLSLEESGDEARSPDLHEAMAFARKHTPPV